MPGISTIGIGLTRRRVVSEEAEELQIGPGFDLDDAFDLDDEFNINDE